MDELTKLTPSQFPPQLLEIPEPPKQLYLRGKLPPQDAFFLCVVGARKHTPYGKQVTEMLIDGLRGYNVVILSGLALGIDSIAHRSALNGALPTIAVPGSGLSFEVLYPQSHLGLAREIVTSGGCLLSEFEPDFRATTYSFPQRNRIMAGLCHATLVVEAEAPSGTLITSRLATEYNRDVFAVPGSIFSPLSRGSNFLLRQGATPITSASELLQAIGLEDKKNNSSEIL